MDPLSAQRVAIVNTSCYNEIEEAIKMAKSATLNIRTDPAIKRQAERIYQSFGITLSDAVNIFLRKSIMEGGLPFDMRTSEPSAETLAAMRETEDILSGRVQAKRYASARELFDDLDAEVEREDADA